MDFSPNLMLPFLVSVTLTGLVRISKMRYHWKDLSLKLLLFLNLYPASRGPSIFLDKSGRLKRSVAWRDKTGIILEPRTNRISKHENRVLSFEKPSFFILTTEKDFRKRFISRKTTITIRIYIGCMDQRNLRLQFEQS